MRATIVLAAALAWTGCSREGDVVGAPTSTPEPSRPPARAPVRSCVASEPPRAVEVDPRIDLGVAGGMNWLFGYAAGDAVLIRLGPDGALALTPVPLHNTQAAAIEGDRIWLYAPREGPDAPARWTAVDVSDPNAPRTGAVSPVAISAEFSFAAAFAVGRRRAVVWYGLSEAQELVVLDTETRAAVRAPTPLEKGMLPVRAFCGDDRCGVVAIRDEGGGPSRRLVVLRAGADGSVEHELLAPDWIGETHVLAAGDRVYVQWSGHEGLQVRALDRAGRPLGPATSAGSSPPLHDGELLPGLAAPLLALGERGRWSVAALAPNATPGRPRAVPGAVHYFFTGAALDDGLAWASISGDVSYDEIGHTGTMVHSWRTVVTAGFLADDGAEHHADVVSTGGPGRGGFGVWVLVRPGRAAVLTVPEGDARHEPDGARLFSLRGPCSPGPARP